MSESINKITEVEASKMELLRLINWIKDNPEDWYRICNSESFHNDIDYIKDLVEKLCSENLFTVMYFFLYSNRYVRGVDYVIDKTISECLIETPISVLVERLCKNLELKAMEDQQGLLKEEVYGKV